MTRRVLLALGLGVLFGSTRKTFITRTFPFFPEHNRVDEFFCQNNRDYKPLFGAK